MAYSSSDFVDDVLNHLYDNDLLDRRIMDAGDMQQQKNAVVLAINKLLDQRAGEWTSQAGAAISQGQTLATQFMTELLYSHETLTGIGEQRGMHTLADCTYLLSAIQKGTSISVEYPTESQIADVVKALPSASLWMTYVHEVHEVTQ